MKTLALAAGAVAACVCAALGGASAARAQSVSLFDSGRLLLTGGVASVEGSGGGGIATWAPVTGYGTRDGVGLNAHATYLPLKDFDFRAFGVSAGLFDRVELSYTRQAFDTRSAGAKLGLGKGFTFDQDVWGVKARLIGDLVYDQDTLLPVISVGAQYKSNDKGAVVHAVGAQRASGIDYYLSATKLFLAQSLLVSGAVRLTEANQTGLLGFGGDRNRGYRPEFEGSAAYLINKHIAIGAEVRTKPDNLGFAKEDDWGDVFVAYAINKHLSVTAAYADLGDIATFRKQRGLYLSLQAGF